MFLTPQLVEALKDKILNPAKNGLDIRPLKECYQESTTCTAQHNLYKEQLKETPNLPKLMYYIIMEDVFGPCNGKDADGNLGWYLTFVEKPA